MVAGPNDPSLGSDLVPPDFDSTGQGPFVLSPSITKLLIVYYGISLATSLFCTVCIVVRIVWIHLYVRSTGIQRSFRSSYAKIVEVVVESSAVYSSALIAHVVFARQEIIAVNRSQTYLVQLAVSPFAWFLRLRILHSHRELHRRSSSAALLWDRHAPIQSGRSESCLI